MELLALTLFLAPSPCELTIEGRRMAEPYFEAVREYRAGATDTPVARFLALETPAVEDLLIRLEQPEGVFRHPDSRRPDDACLQAASLLHLEAGRKALDEFFWSRSDFHLDAGWRFALLLSSEELRASFQRDWLLAVGLAHQETIFTGAAPHRGYTEADRFLAEAVTRYPKDPEILLSHGALLEWAGSLPWGEPARLNEAGSLYRRALEVDPGNPEAVARYGWTLRKLGKSREAAEALSRILTLPTPDNLIYRSRMGLGALAEKADRHEEAIGQYERAIELIPEWQVGHLALSHALHVTGAHQRAREVLASGLRLPASREALDGWWSYELGSVPMLEPLLSRMRSQVTQ